MARTKSIAKGFEKPAGYTALTERYRLVSLPHWQESRIASGGTRKTIVQEGQVLEIYPPQYDPGEGLGPQLEFALKYEGINLEILALLFAALDPKDLTAWIREKPVGKYTRTIWYLYELLTGQRLGLDDLTTGNFFDLLPSEDYYTAQPRPVARQRIRDNLLGDSRFCPMVRRTETLRKFEGDHLDRRCEEVIKKYPSDVLQRALSYLYTKETKSSFEIEHLRVEANRASRFIAQLRLAGEQDFFSKEALLRLQNSIVDPRFGDTDFRSTQNYVGETIMGQETVHYVSPKPQDLPSLMEGMFVSHWRMTEAKIHPVITAAVVSFGFVFMHPFEDGNGRIHRFLIHHILSRAGFSPRNMIFPVSAILLKQRQAYDETLELVSRPLMPMIDFLLDNDGRMTVLNETAVHYRYLDLTAIAERLFRFIQDTIETELVEELDFIQKYDAARRTMQEIVDMPDRLIDLFIRFCLQNHGKLSAAKQASHFSNLTEEEIRKLEATVQENFILK